MTRWTYNEEPPAPTPRSLCLIRHGETTANRDAIIAGRLNVSLTEQGRNQARALAQTHWPEPITVFCSPMERACETAHLGFPMSKPTVIPGLHERDWGIFEGQPLSELPPRDRTPRTEKAGETWCYASMPQSPKFAQSPSTVFQCSSATRASYAQRVCSQNKRVWGYAPKMHGQSCSTIATETTQKHPLIKFPQGVRSTCSGPGTCL